MTVVRSRAQRIGLLVITLAVVVQTLLHLVNYFTWEVRWLDVNEEYTPFSAMGALTLAAAAGGAFLLVRAGLAARRVGWSLAALLAVFALDEFFSLHERGTDLLLDLVGVSRDLDSVVWPALYLPMTGAAFLLMVLLARRAPESVRRLLYVGLALLVIAVVAEIASAPFSTADTADETVHAIEGVFEEACELGGWGLIALALLSWPSVRRSSVPLDDLPAARPSAGSTRQEGRPVP